MAYMSQSNASELPQPSYLSQVTNRLKSTARESEELPLETCSRRSFNLEKGNEEPEKANECLFEETSPPFEDKLPMNQNLDVLAPDPEAKLNEDTVRRSLCERAFTLGASKLFSDIECGLITAHNIQEHISSASDVVVNLTLLWAAFLSRDDLLPHILNSGAEIHTSDPAELTALHLAAFRGAGRSAEFLLSQGANPNFAPKYFAPLHCAAFGNSLEVAEILIAHSASLQAVVQRAGCEDNLVHCAVRCDAVECMELFIEKAVDPGYATSGGLNALHLAAGLGAQRCLAFLLKETKIPVNEVTKQRDRECTALHLASARGSAECVELLLSNGAEANMKNYRRFTALHLAAQYGRLECVEILLRKGKADPNAEEFYNRTSLHSAVNKSDRACEIIKVLSRWGAQVNKKDKDGHSPLHLAAIEGLTPCIETLIFLGADVTSKSKKGHTALSVIARKTPKSLAILRDNLDCGISFSHSSESKEEVQIQFDFGRLLKFSYPHQITYLNTLIDEGQNNILQHPLCSALLFMKWEKVRKFYLARLIFSFVFASFLSTYVLAVLVKTCKGKHSQKYGVPNELYQKQSLLGDILEYHPIEFERWALTIMAAFEVIRKFTGIIEYSSFRQYFTTFKNLLEWYVILSVFSLYNICKDYSWQNHVGGYAVLGAWTNLMLVIGQLPMFGDYVAMYQKVLKEFVKLLMPYLCLLLGFAICFCVVFPNEEIFSNPLMGIISTLSMMVGELNLNILINDPMLDDPPLIFELSSQVIFILFLIFVTITLMNMVVGIAVLEIQTFKKSARLSKLVRQTKQIFRVEKSIIHRWLPRCFQKFISRIILLSPEDDKVTINVHSSGHPDNHLPSDIIKAAYALARSNQMKTGKSQDVSFQNQFTSMIPKETKIVDENFAREIQGMHEKIDQTTSHLKKIDLEMGHLSELLMEQQTLLQKLLGNMNKGDVNK